MASWEILVVVVLDLGTAEEVLDLLLDVVLEDVLLDVLGFLALEYLHLLLDLLLIPPFVVAAVVVVAAFDPA